MNNVTTICLQWPALGPYHIARLTALARVGLTRDLRVVALETASTDSVYAWDPVARSGLEVVTAFPGQVFEGLRPREIYDGIMQRLSDISPDVVMTNSYSFPDARASLKWAVQNKIPAIVGTDSHLDPALRIGWQERIKASLLSLYDGAVVAGTPHVEYLAGLGFPTSRIFKGLDVVDNDFFVSRLADSSRRFDVRLFPVISPIGVRGLRR